MTGSRVLPSRPDWRAGSPGKRLLGAYLVSLLLHGLLLLGLTGSRLAAPPRADTTPVYQVDLVHPPVLNPQAGRPEPRSAPAPPMPASPPAEKVPVRTTAPTKPSPVAKTPVRSDERHMSDALQRMRDEQALRERMNALRRGQQQAVPADIPIGLPDAKGNQAGVTTLVYVQGTIQQNWALSPYTLGDSRKMEQIEAWVRITYGKNGRLEHFRIEKASGDLQFDESIKRALIKSQQLPVTLPERLEDIRVVFNLKALAEVRR